MTDIGALARRLDSGLRRNDGHGGRRRCRQAGRPQYPHPPASSASSPLLGRGGIRGASRPDGGEIPAYAGMTGQGALARLWIPAYAGMTARGRLRADWIPAYAGMTVIVGGARRRMAIVVGRRGVPSISPAASRSKALVAACAVWDEDVDEGKGRWSRGAWQSPCVGRVGGRLRGMQGSYAKVS